MSFKKGQYIVISHNHLDKLSYPTNFVFKINRTEKYLHSIDCEGEENGWSIFPFKSKELSLDIVKKWNPQWRFAYSFEIMEYEKLGKPFKSDFYLKDNLNYNLIYKTVNNLINDFENITIEN